LNIFEILLLLAVALIVVGPERLPEVLQMVGKVMRELRLASNTVMRELTEVTEEPRKTIRELDPFASDTKLIKPENHKPDDSPTKP
jgi:Tat protein translocase TatB subunit